MLAHCRKRSSLRCTGFLGTRSGGLRWVWVKCGRHGVLIASGVPPTLRPNPDRSADSSRPTEPTGPVRHRMLRVITPREFGAALGPRQTACPPARLPACPLRRQTSTTLTNRRSTSWWAGSRRSAEPSLLGPSRVRTQHGATMPPSRSIPQLGGTRRRTSRPATEIHSCSNAPAGAARGEGVKFRAAA